MDSNQKASDENIFWTAKLLSAIAEQTGDGFTVADKSGHYTFVNNSFCEMTQYSKEELLTMTVFDILPSDVISKLFDQVSKRGEKGVREVKLQRKDGSTFLAEIYGFPIEVEGNELVLGTVRDITEKKIAIEKIRSSESRLKILFEESPISLWEEDFSQVKLYLDDLDIKNKDSLRKYLLSNKESVKQIAKKIKIIDVNQSTLDLYNITDKQTLLMDFTKIYNEESYEIFIGEILSLYFGETNFEIEISGYKATGEPIDLLIRFSVVPGFAKTLSKVIVSVIDITEVKSLGKKYQDLIETINDLVWEVDTKGCFNYVSPRCLELTGYSPEELLSKRYQDIIPKNEERDIPRVFSQFISKKLPFIRIENKIEKKSGQLVFLESSGMPILNDSGELLGYRGVSRDVTFRKKAERKLKYRVEFEHLISEISTKFISTPANQIKEQIEDSLKKISDFSQVDLAYIRTINQDSHTCSISYLWKSENLAINKKDFQNLDLNLLETTLNAIIDKGYTVIPSINERISEYQNLKHIFLHSEIKSILYVGMFNKGELIALLGIGLSRERTWTNDEINLLKFVGRIFTNFLIQMQDNLEIQKLSTALEQSFNSIVITNVNGTIEYVNPYFSQISGYSFEEAIGRTPRILKSGTHDLSFYKNLWQTISQGNVWRGEFHNKKKDGTFHWEQATISPIKDIDGKIINYIGVKEDITAKKIFEETLKNEKAKIETNLDNIAEGILIFELNGDLYLANKQFRKYYAKIYKQDIPKSIFDFPVERNSFNEVIVNLFNSSGAELVTINPIEGFHLQLESTTIKISKEIKSNISIIARDITSFVEFNQLREQFVSTVSHELRTPITSINLAIKSLKKYQDRLDEKKRNKLLDIIDKSSSILTTMVDDLLILSRLEAGKIIIQWDEYDLINVISDVKFQFGLKLEQKKSEILIKGELKTNLRGDSKRIEQVIRILVDNAIKYSPDNSLVQILVVDNYKGNYNPASHNGVLVQIIDNGEGIPKKDLQRLFQRFFRSETVSKISGNGLGLSIAKEIVNLHGGEIYVDSQWQKGTTFSLFLPRNILKPVID